MSLQTAVGFTIAAGIVGEFFKTGPRRVKPALLNSATPANNVIGRAAVVKTGATGSFPVAGDGGANPMPMTVGIGEAGLGGEYVFAGLLMLPKNYVSYGGAAGPLSPTTVVPNGLIVELATEGDPIVSLPAAANPGDVVYFVEADGTLKTAAPGAAIPAGCTGPIGTVEMFTSTAANIAVINLRPRVPSVAP